MYRKELASEREKEPHEMVWKNEETMPYEHRSLSTGVDLQPSHAPSLPPHRRT